MFQCDRNPNKGATQLARGTTVNKPPQKLKKKYQKLYLFKRTDQNSGQEISLKIAWVSMGYIVLQRIVFLSITGSRGDVFVLRTSKPVENLWKSGLFWSRYSFVTHSIYRKPRDWGLARSAYSINGRRAVRQRGYGLRLLIFKMANNKVDLGQIRSEEIVYSRFIKIPLG